MSADGVLPVIGPLVPAPYVRVPRTPTQWKNAVTDAQHVTRMSDPGYRRAWLRRWNDPAIRARMAAYADEAYGPVRDHPQHPDQRRSAA